MNNIKGQTQFIALIVFVMGFLILIFASPILFTMIGIGAEGLGSATKFVVKSFPWVLLLIFIAVFFSIVRGGGGFFT